MELTDCEKINASAALPPLPITRKDAHPKRKEKKLPKLIQKYSKMPPLSLVMVAIPAIVNAPNIETIPANAHASRIYSLFIKTADIGAIFLNTPEPMILPVTIKIPDVSPSSLLNGIFY